MKVMVIDDDLAAVDGLREALACRWLTPELCVADTAAEGLRQLRRDAPDCPVLVANPASWPGRLDQAVHEFRAVAPQTMLLALLSPKGALTVNGAMQAGFDDAFVKHEGIYPLLGRLVLEVAERAALTRQQQRLSKACSDAEFLLSAVMRTSEDAVLILDAEGLLTVANARFSRLINRPLADILRQPVWVHLDQKSVAALRALLHTPERSGSVSLPLTFFDNAGGTVSGDARVVIREHGPRRQSAVLSFHPVEVPPIIGLPVLASRTAERVTECSSEVLRQTLRARCTPPVLVRVRPSAARRQVTHGSSMPAAILSALQQVIRGEIGQLLVEGDLLFAVGEDSFVLLAEENTIQAMRRLGRTIPVLRERLLSSPELGQALLALGGARLVEQIHTVTELQITAAPLDFTVEDLGHEDMAGLVAACLQTEEAALGVDALRALNDLRMHAACELRMVQDQHGAPSVLCLPSLDEITTLRFAKLADQASSRPKLALQLTLMMLEWSIEALAREVDRESSLIILDLHFTVLTHRRLAERFMDRCRALPPEVTRLFVVNLVGVPPGAYPPKFARLTGLLQELFRLKAMTVKDIRAELVDLDMAKIGLVIVDCHNLEALLDDRHDLVQALVRRAHRSQARVLVRKAPRAIASELRQLGVDFTSAA